MILPPFRILSASENQHGTEALEAEINHEQLFEARKQFRKEGMAQRKQEQLWLIRIGWEISPGFGVGADTFLWVQSSYNQLEIAPAKHVSVSQDVNGASKNHA